MERECFRTQPLVSIAEELGGSIRRMLPRAGKIESLTDEKVSPMMPVQIKRAVYRTCGLQSYFIATALYRVARGCERTYEEFLRRVPQGGLLLDIAATLVVT